MRAQRLASCRSFATVFQFRVVAGMPSHFSQKALFSLVLVG